MESLTHRTGITCLECQHLHRPNPVEDIFMCLRSLRLVEHELDEGVVCGGFDEIAAEWAPVLGVYGWS